MANTAGENEAEVAFCSKPFDVCYDVITALISLFDMITDVWILIQWYYQDRMVFFSLSLTILLLANFSYTIVFNTRYRDFYPCKICFFSWILLPIAPFLSIIMYFIDACGNEYECAGYIFETRSERRWTENPTKNGGEPIKWMQHKLSKHIGFVLQAIMEAFPQCCLQLVALMHFNEINIIAIISIIISMASISSKSLIFTAGTSINIKTMMFTWIYIISDVFGIFLAISFVFYTQDDGAYNILRYIWFSKLTISVLLCFICSIPIYKAGLFQAIREVTNDWRTECTFTYICAFISCFLFILPIWASAMMLGITALETGAFTYITFIVYRIGHGRIPTNVSSKTWNKIRHWITAGDKNQIIQRICCINRQLLLMKNDDQ
eukprot:334283_1